jgi:hypothetical protein
MHWAADAVQCLLDRFKGLQCELELSPLLPGCMLLPQWTRGVHAHVAYDTIAAHGQKARRVLDELVGAVQHTRSKQPCKDDRSDIPCTLVTLSCKMTERAVLRHLLKDPVIATVCRGNLWSNVAGAVFRPVPWATSELHIRHDCCRLPLRCLPPQQYWWQQDRWVCVCQGLWPRLCRRRRAAQRPPTRCPLVPNVYVSCMC